MQLQYGPIHLNGLRSVTVVPTNRNRGFHFYMDLACVTLWLPEQPKQEGITEAQPPKFTAPVCKFKLELRIQKKIVPGKALDISIIPEGQEEEERNR